MSCDPRLVSERTVEENILKKASQKKLLGDIAIEGGAFTTDFFKKVGQDTPPPCPNPFRTPPHHVLISQSGHSEYLSPPNRHR